MAIIGTKTGLKQQTTRTKPTELNWRETAGAGKTGECVDGDKLAMSQGGVGRQDIRASRSSRNANTLPE